jgi:hypothetical protein
MDTRNDVTAIPLIVNIDDRVSGYTNQQFFNSFTSSTNSLATSKSSFLSKVGANQTATTNINNLFASYGY